MNNGKMLQRAAVIWLTDGCGTAGSRRGRYGSGRSGTSHGWAMTRRDGRASGDGASSSDLADRMAGLGQDDYRGPRREDPPQPRAARRGARR